MPQSGFVITPLFDASVTSSPDAANYEKAVNTAIAYLESQITTPMTISIRFGYGENGGTQMPPASGGSSSVTSSSVEYSKLYAAVQATGTTSAVQIAAAALLPTTDPTKGGTFFVAPAEQIALGLMAATSAPAGAIGLSVDTYNWSQTGTQDPNGSDAVSEFEHEITEVMGRTSFHGTGNAYTLLDMYRYTAADGKNGDAVGSAAGTRDQPFDAGYKPNAPAYFSYDGKTVGLEYDTSAEVAAGSDLADWTATVPKDSFDGAGPPGEIDPMSKIDLQELNVLGYTLAVQCFVTGTHIATLGGTVAVESLRPGDLVRTAEGDALPVRFVGVQTVATRFVDPLRLPVRIRAGALAESVPSRDLLVSPGHAVFVDGLLVHASALANVNSMGIVRETSMPETFQYWHVELDCHALLLAEGCATESYLAAIETVRFDNAADRPDLAAAAEMPYPRAKAVRQLPLDLRTRLVARNAHLAGAMLELAAA